MPGALQDRLIDQHHCMLNHPGMAKMKATIRKAIDFRRLHEKVEHCSCTCHICQIKIEKKKWKKKYGQIPPQESRGSNTMEAHKH